jgi:hypothetical protein
MAANVNGSTLVCDAKTVEQYVTLRRYATFSDIQKDLKDLMPTRGDYEYRISCNIVLWVGLSERLLDALAKLVVEARVHLTPASLWHYAQSGVMPNLPVVYPKELCQYPIPHWMPVLVYPGPSCMPDASGTELIRRLCPAAANPVAAPRTQAAAPRTGMYEFQHWPTPQEKDVTDPYLIREWEECVAGGLSDGLPERDARRIAWDRIMGRYVKLAKENRR